MLTTVLYTGRCTPRVDEYAIFTRKGIELLIAMADQNMAKMFTVGRHYSLSIKYVLY